MLFRSVEVSTLEPMSQIIQHNLNRLCPVYTVLSGPSFALDVSRRLPTAVTLGCADERLGSLIQRVFATDFFRVYVNTDVPGVELGGALKNIMALAAGISDGLGFGASARSALITHSLNILFGLVILTIIMPSQVLSLPQYLYFGELGSVDRKSVV